MHLSIASTKNKQTFLGDIKTFETFQKKHLLHLHAVLRFRPPKPQRKCRGGLPHHQPNDALHGLQIVLRPTATVDPVQAGAASPCPSMPPRSPPPAHRSDPRRTHPGQGHPHRPRKATLRGKVCVWRDQAAPLLAGHGEGDVARRQRRPDNAPLHRQPDTLAAEPPLAEPAPPEGGGMARDRNATLGRAPPHTAREQGKRWLASGRPGSERKKAKRNCDV